jgi:hypothetical protein
MLREIVGDQSTSHMIISTHNPLLIAELERSQVQVMQRSEPAGRITAQVPDQDPRGMGIAGLLTSEIYGLRSQLDLPTLALLDEKRILATRDGKNAEELRRLSDINEALEGLGFRDSDRDPMFEAFEQAMTEAEHREGLQVPVLTKDQIHRRNEIAKSVLRQIRSRDS